MADYFKNQPFVLTISKDLTKMSEVRKAGDRSNSLGTNEKKIYLFT